MRAELYILKIFDAPLWNVAYSVMCQLLYVAVIIWLICSVKRGDDRITEPEWMRRGINGKSWLPFALLAAVIFVFIGFCPSGPISDRTVYARNFDFLASGGIPSMGTFHNVEAELMLGSLDPAYKYMVKWCALVFPSHEWFFALTGLIFVGCMAFACRRLAPENALLLFLVMAGSTFFFNYGTAALRQGLAAAIVICSYTLPRRRWPLILLMMAFAVGIHLSVIIMCVAYWIAVNFKRTDVLVYIWIVIAAISFFIGPFLTEIIASVALPDPRLYSYIVTSKDYAESGYFTGFRIDFALYTLLPIAVGVYAIYFRRYRNRLYKTLLNTYIFISMVWLFVIRVPFTDRFAALAWLLGPIVVFMPLLGQRRLTTVGSGVTVSDRLQSPQVLMIVLMCVQLALKYFHIRLIY